jgi:H+/gluconate symporter-like permease
MYVVFNYLTRLPVLLIWLVGAVLALVWWKRHSRVSLYLLLALAALFAGSLFSPAGYSASPMYSGRYGHSGEMTLLLVFGSIVQAVLNTAAWVLILLAVFGGRKAAASKSPSSDKD